jgi:hypothetical protein
MCHQKEFSRTFHRGCASYYERIAQKNTFFLTEEFTGKKIHMIAKSQFPTYTTFIHIVAVIVDVVAFGFNANGLKILPFRKNFTGY